MPSYQPLSSDLFVELWQIGNPGVAKFDTSLILKSNLVLGVGMRLVMLHSKGALPEISLR